MGIFGTLGNVLKGAAPIAGALIPGVGPLAGMAVSAGISGLQNKGKANSLNKQAQGIAMGNWNDTAPLRSKALQMALAPRAPREDLSAMFADPGNPYARVNPRPEPSADLSRVAPVPAPVERSRLPFMGGGAGMGGAGVGLMQRALARRDQGGAL